MKRKSDKKYSLSMWTCLALIVVMVISLVNKKTYSTCLGINSPDNNHCCQSKGSFSDNVTYSLAVFAQDECSNYATNNKYEYYECNVIEVSNDTFMWNLTYYHDCQQPIDN